MPLSHSAGVLNFASFNRIVRAAAVSGIVAGLVLTAVQQVQVSGIIQQAETYENAPVEPPAAMSAPSMPAPAAAPGAPAPEPAMASTPAHSHAGAAGHAHAHAHGSAHAHAHPPPAQAEAAPETSVATAPAEGAPAEAAPETIVPAAVSTPAPVEAPAHAHGGAADGHDHEHGGWQPENGAERTFFTTLANISMGVAYGLLLAAAMCLRGGSVGWRQGLLWGAAGYAVIFVAPSIGLPPELPGTLAAPLAARQLWWLMTALATGAGLAMLVHARSWTMRLTALLLFAAPHLVGAPQPAVHGGTAPADLVRAFLYASAIANAIFWLALGGVAGAVYKKAA